MQTVGKITTRTNKLKITKEYTAKIYIGSIITLHTEEKQSSCDLHSPRLTNERLPSCVICAASYSQGTEVTGSGALLASGTTLPIFLYKDDDDDDDDVCVCVCVCELVRIL